MKLLSTTDVLQRRSFNNFVATTKEDILLEIKMVLMG